MRTLAQRSASAAKEIKALIHDSVSQVGEGAKLVGQAGATMSEIVASVKRVTDIIGEIAAANQEQTAGIEQINRAVSVFRLDHDAASARLPAMAMAQFPAPSMQMPRV